MDKALVGVQLKASDIFGSFTPDGRFVASPARTAEADFEADLLGTYRLFSNGQVTALIPLVGTWRSVPGLSEAGGGLGDVQLAARWDFLLAGESKTIPGIAVLAGITFPTGRAPESASSPLATDSTGNGTWQGSFAVALEQTFGKVLVNLTGSATIHAARSFQGESSQQGHSFTAFVAGGYSFADGKALLALTALYAASLDARAEEAIVPNSARTNLRLGLAGGVSLTDQWRLQGSLYADPPIRYLGENQPTAVGLTATVVRAF